MNHKSLTNEEISKAGLAALVRELGPAGMLRFIQQFEPGKGDYTAERHNWLPTDMDKVMDEIRSMKNRGELYPK